MEMGGFKFHPMSYGNLTQISHATGSPEITSFNGKLHICRTLIASDSNAFTKCGVFLGQFTKKSNVLKTVSLNSDAEVIHVLCEYDMNIHVGLCYSRTD